SRPQPLSVTSSVVRRVIVWVVAVVIRCHDDIAIAVVFTAVVVESDTAPSAWSNCHWRHLAILAGSGVFGMLPALRWLSGPGAVSEMSLSQVPVAASASAGNLQWIPLLLLLSGSMLSHVSRFPKA
ncbi:hypothetical protein EDB84DRAFT_1504725, partial [Lactarius hengduanensis]